MGERRHDLDWLRTLASYLVIIYHTAQFFDFQKKTYIKNGDLSWAMEFFVRFVHIWHMPLFFLLAGWSARASLGGRGAGGFLLERLRRLGIPLLFGLCFWCSVPRWLELKNGLFKTGAGERLPAQPAIPFTAFLKEYYYTAEGVSWGHLWFLAYLLTFSILYLPGLWVLSKVGDEEKWLHSSGGWTVANAPAILLVVIQLRLRDRWPGFQNLVDDWANFWFYSTFFITGFCLAQFPVLEKHQFASRWFNLALAIPLSILCVLAVPSSVEHHVLFALGAWFMVLSLLSLGRYAFNGKAAPSFWASKAFPVYVAHDVPLALLADWLVPSWPAPILVKHVALVGSDLVLTLLLLWGYSSARSFLFGTKKDVARVPLGKRVD